MKVKGKLYNEQMKESVAFANVYISDKDGIILSPQKGTQSNIDGYFTLENINPDSYLAISYVGLPKHVVKINSLPKDKNGDYFLDKKYLESENTLPIVEIIAPRIKKETKKNRKNLYIGLGIGAGVLAIAGTVLYFKLK